MTKTKTRTVKIRIREIIASQDDRLAKWYSKPTAAAIRSWLPNETKPCSWSDVHAALSWLGWRRHEVEFTDLAPDLDINLGWDSPEVVAALGPEADRVIVTLRNAKTEASNTRNARGWGQFIAGDPVLFSFVRLGVTHRVILDPVEEAGSGSDRCKAYWEVGEAGKWTRVSGDLVAERKGRIDNSFGSGEKFLRHVLADTDDYGNSYPTPPSVGETRNLTGDAAGQRRVDEVWQEWNDAVDAWEIDGKNRGLLLHQIEGWLANRATADKPLLLRAVLAVPSDDGYKVEDTIVFSAKPHTLPDGLVRYRVVIP